MEGDAELCLQFHHPAIGENQHGDWVTEAPWTQSPALGVLTDLTGSVQV